MHGIRVFVLQFNIQSKTQLRKHKEMAFQKLYFSDKKGSKTALFQGISPLFKVIFQKQFCTISRQH